MNPLIKKEIRLLLPAWIVAMLLVIFSPWINILLGCLIYNSVTEWTAQGGLHFWLPLVAFGFLFLGLTSFGQEFSSGTFSTLLSQPMERRRLWQVKTTTLAVAFVSVWAMALLSGYIFFVLWIDEGGAFWTLFQQEFFAAFKSDTFVFLTLSILVTFTGGLWTTLLLRQTTGAFWFTLLIPLAITFGTVVVFQNWITVSDETITHFVTTALVLYSLAGFFLARRLFFRAQDAQWTGGEISFPGLGKFFKSSTASVSIRPRHWMSALVWKEIHLQQANILIAVIILALNLLSVLIRKIHPHFENPNVQLIFEVHWMLWLLMPLLIGAVAIAEERRLGIHEAQLCLSVSRRTQLFVKFSVALVLSLLLGGAMPLLLEGVKELDPFYAVFIAVAVIFFPSFYSSSAVRTTLQAIGLAILLGLAIILFEAVGAYNIIKIGNYSSSTQLGLALLNLYLGPPILLLALGWLTLWNFERLHENRQRWRRNLLTVLAAFASIFILINGIYFRAWELLTPAESRGPARLDSSTRVTLVQNYSTLYATLPDGRIWTETLDFQNISNRWQQTTVIVPDRCRAQFLAGSNWLQVAADTFQAMGIQSDGTLWSVQRKWNPSRGRWNQTGAFTTTKIGSDTDWSQVAGGSLGFLILKKNGSLWVWGNHGFPSHYRSNIIPKKLKSDLATLPVSIGDEATYTKLFSSIPSPYAMKSDGSCWTWQNETNSTMVIETNLNNQWSNLTFLGDSSVGVKTNDELWYNFTLGYSAGGKHDQIQRHIQLGTDAKWKAATLEGDAILALREDGTLWRWSPRWDLWENTPLLVKAVQLGNYPNWMALAGSWDDGLALAPDGNLYAWDQPSPHVWLAPSRKPVYIGNIFEGAP